MVIRGSWYKNFGENKKREGPEAVILNESNVPATCENCGNADQNAMPPSLTPVIPDRLWRDSKDVCLNFNIYTQVNLGEKKFPLACLVTQSDEYYHDFNRLIRSMMQMSSLLYI